MDRLVVDGDRVAGISKALYLSLSCERAGDGSIADRIDQPVGHDASCILAQEFGILQAVVLRAPGRPGRGRRPCRGGVGGQIGGFTTCQEGNSHGRYGPDVQEVLEGHMCKVYVSRARVRG